MVVLLGYIFFFELGDINSFAFAAPAIREQWQLSITATSQIISATFVGMFVGATTGGWFSDRIGRKRALIATTLWYSSFSLLNALVWNVGNLYATRLLTGVALSAMTVVAITYISEMFPAPQAWRLPGLDHDDRALWDSGNRLRGALHRPGRAVGLAMVFVWGSLALFFPFFARRLEESPRWYENQGRTAEADAAVERIEQQVAQETGPLAPVLAPESVATESRQGGFAALFAPGTMNRTLLLIAVWICQTLGFYGERKR